MNAFHTKKLAHSRGRFGIQNTNGQAGITGAHESHILASVPLVLTFVNEVAATRYECQNHHVPNPKFATEGLAKQDQQQPFEEQT